MAFRDAPSQVFQHRQGSSLRHDKTKPFKCRFEIIGVNHSHSQSSFCGLGTLATGARMQLWIVRGLWVEKGLWTKTRKCDLCDLGRRKCLWRQMTLHWSRYG